MQVQKQSFIKIKYTVIIKYNCKIQFCFREQTLNIMWMANKQRKLWLLKFESSKLTQKLFKNLVKIVGMAFTKQTWWQYLGTWYIQTNLSWHATTFHIMFKQTWIGTIYMWDKIKPAKLADDNCWRLWNGPTDPSDH
jgi:hypothetical protein